ncbi:MAG: endonuclease/exonuclease/phosphatase family protein [Candidatus Competibacteraceae bacterium]|nr:endonuclease/exonuclease/phosphatase family protein [Candidatus Competibacteraceae bacterium]MCP5125741.1 endonuclease/exonuclease/phosphatase family protein [Gammaproteobacteria bacterium]HRX71716.1 endonuclease/exonuclease/phosphatase family protein [Candidatus Competibacteraceae bacterium]
MSSIFRIRLAGLLDAASALACIATLAGLAGQFWWMFDLAAHFRVQYALVLGLGAISALIQRHRRWTVVFAGFTLLNIVLLTPRLLPGAEAVTRNDEPVFRVLLANINSAHRDPAAIHRAITDEHPDFILLLEITPWMLDQLANLADGYPYRVAEPREDNFGIALFSRQPFLKSEIFRWGPAELPSILAEIPVGQHRFTLLGTHPPPPVSAELSQSRNEQLALLTQRVRQARQPLLLLGDLNLSPWSPWFGQLLTDSGLQDSANGRGIQPTWPVSWPPLWIPIDHALFSEGIQIRRRAVGADLGSDHFPIVVEFQVTRR